MAKLRNRSYRQNGVAIAPTIPKSKQRAKLSYNGLLAKNGATEVYAHVGFGSQWRQTRDYKMDRVGNRFEAMIPVSNNTQMRVCFKDTAEHWDNNSGKNYSFDIIC